MRMEVTAAYAAAHGFPAFTTTNATSRWKDVQQVNDSGLRAAARYARGGALRTAASISLTAKRPGTIMSLNGEYAGTSIEND